MSQYTTGDIARLCNVSVRTVQFYDTKGLMKPSALTEGGRRLYSDDDLKQFRLICLLKSLGLTLDSIKGIISSKISGKVLKLLLNEQLKLIEADISEKEEQRKAIEVVKERICNMREISANLLCDIEQIMNSKKKLRKVHGSMLAVGIIMDIIQIGAILLWVLKGIWLPFIIGMPVVILMGILITRMYYKKTAYICPECGTVFKPTLSKFIFSKHTPKTRKLECPSCRYEGYCVETCSDGTKE